MKEEGSSELYPVVSQIIFSPLEGDHYLYHIDNLVLLKSSVVTVINFFSLTAVTQQNHNSNRSVLIPDPYFFLLSARRFKELL